MGFVIAPWAAATSGIRLDANGRVGIGTPTPDVPLTVVTANANGFTSISSFVNDALSHLPEVPTAEEVKNNGLDLGDNQATLLQKIEELTLYVIEQQKKMQEMETKIKVLEEKGKK